MKAYWKSNGHFPDGKESKKVYFEKDGIWHDAWFVGSKLIHHPYWLQDLAIRHNFGSIENFCQVIFRSKEQVKIFEL